MAAHTLGARPRTGDVLQGPGEAPDFNSLLLSRPVLEGLEAAGFSRPSPIQSKAIPLGRCGLDLIVQAKSGTGKTCVFSTVALDSLILENLTTQILVLAPTREIAVQIHAVITSIGSRMEGLQCHVFIGGTPLPLDKTRLKKCHIAVGSPGRIKQLIEIGYLNTASIRLFILDEADKLLEEGSFQDQINWIYSSLPANKQMLAVSATYPESLAKALTRYMREPTFVRLNVSDPSLLGLKQYYKVVNSNPLPHKIFEEKVQHLQELFSRVPFNQALVFSNFHSRAQHLADILTSKGFPSVCISGSMNQNQRLDAMSKLKQFHCRVLISTDLTSRGIDAEKVNLVINLDVPQDWETYMHRIGRAGRYGTYGLSVTYCCRGEEENLMLAIAQKCNLHLLTLPDPIPEGLMEETCNWDVEVTAVKSLSEEFASKTQEIDIVKSSVLSSSSFLEIQAEKNPIKVTQPKVKKVTKKRSTEKGSPPGWKKVDPVNLPKEPDNTDKIKRPSEKVEDKIKRPSEKVEDKIKRPSEKVEDKIKRPSEKVEDKIKRPSEKVEDKIKRPSEKVEDKIKRPTEKVENKTHPEQSQYSFPKIPSLASFKRPVVCTSSFAELVEDYEQFIKEGLEKHVEIIRIYTGPGDSHDNHILEDPGKEIDHEAKMEETINMTEKSNLSENSYSESEDDSFSISSSESEESSLDLDQTHKQERSSDPDVSSRSVVHTAVCNSNTSLSSASVDPIEEASLVETQLEEEVVVGKSRKSKKRNRQAAHLSRRELCQDGRDDLYKLDYRNPNGFPYGNMSYADYWRSYYQAWQTYHSALSSSYYRNVYKRSNWMSAYHMHSVYLHEMLKP
ncbi:probable ATP-dependent RNA helicase DDX20 [Pelobates fuscus]|uniref:probable ATP-dependent RNA helicase DDX20 n=1 Tax=Pelobates fuscus TaxID=191477 RepID=UPI002FE4DAE1